jgi:hypothetical protein
MLDYGEIGVVEFSSLTYGGGPAKAQEGVTSLMEQLSTKQGQPESDYVCWLAEEKLDPQLQTTGNRKHGYPVKWADCH